jgi:hypothetical protein
MPVSDATDIGRGMGNQHRVMIGVKGALVFEKVQQVRHLLEV